MHLLLLAFAGCFAGPPDDHPGSTEPPAGPPDDPLGMDAWTRTKVSMQHANVTDAIVRHLTFTSAARQTCESKYVTEGNISEPWGIGWVIGLSPEQTYFSHEFIREGTVQAELAGTEMPGTLGQAPTSVSGSSGSTITLNDGERMSYYVATSYPAGQQGHGGRMEFEVTCPEGMDSVVAGWSTTASLLSDVSMNGTWASVHVENTARWGSQVMATWSASLTQAPSLFIATEPLVGRATLTTSAGDVPCGPSADPEAAAKGRAHCMHEFEGGDITLQVSQVPPGHYGQSGTADAWMALVAQMQSVEWSPAAATTP